MKVDASPFVPKYTDGAAADQAASTATAESMHSGNLRTPKIDGRPSLSDLKRDFEFYDHVQRAHFLLAAWAPN